MTQLIALIKGHEIILVIAGQFAIASAIDSLPAPTAKSGGFYVFFYKWVNLIAANWSKTKNGTAPAKP
jgi:hypothetical protein